MLYRKNLILTLIALLIAYLPYSGSAQQITNTYSGAYTVIANPGEVAATQIRLNWHSNLGSGLAFITYKKAKDKSGKSTQTAVAHQEICTVFDNLYSKTPANEDVYEHVKFIRNTVELSDLEPNTLYEYTLSNDPKQEVRTFQTATTSGNWTMGIISDFHAYTPLPKRQEAGMAMIAQLEKKNKKPFNAMLHVGDITAWGGSYSFWPNLYNERPFREYLWAGVNGNHDNMTRQNGQSHEFFKNVNNNPLNGYTGQEGVVYHFTYDHTLFIMLNNEVMRSDEGLALAQSWVRQVIQRNPAKFIVVVSHYQWFMGNDGRSSQYHRWKTLFDECGVDLAISGNNHIYVRTNAIYADKETDGRRGTVYIQTTSSDDERGQAMQEWKENKDLIKVRWTEGPKTVSGLILKATKKKLTVTLYDRNGTHIDAVTVKAKR